MAQPLYLGDPHVHSSRSDGRLSPAELSFVASARGLDFLALTDHGTAAAHREGPALCRLAGQEVSTGGRIHLLLLGYAKPLDRRMRLERLPELADRVHAAGGVVILAHPWMGLAKSPDRVHLLDRGFALGHLDGLEIFSAALRPSEFGLWQRMFAHFLREWAPCRPALLASSDWHHRRHGRALGLCCTYVQAPELAPAALLGALAARRTVAALQPATALEDGLFPEPLPFPAGAGQEGLQWHTVAGGAFCGPRDLVQALLRLRAEALAHLRATARALPPGEGVKREILRSALAAYAAGNYRRALTLLANDAR